MSYMTFNVILEEKLSTKERNQLPDSEFGIPSQRRFPLHDKTHVEAGIRFFNHVDQEHEEELARNIIKKMREYEIPMDTVGKDNRLYKYIHKNEGKEENK